MSAAAARMSPAPDPRGPRCPLCAGEASSFAGRRRDGVAFRSCAECGLAFAGAAPASRRAVALHPDDGAAYEPFGADPLRLEMRILRSHADLRGMKALEVGCASGTLLSLLAAEGCRVCGVELNPAMAERTRRTLGIQVYEQPLETGLPVLPHTVDVLVACSVLEHSAAPGRFLDEIRRLAAPGALLLLVTPDWSASETAGDGWTGWHGQWDRLCYFSGTTLDRALTQRGFEAVLRGKGGPPAGIRQVRRAARRQRLRGRISSIPVVGPAAVHWKRHLFPVEPEKSPADCADLIALYRFTGAAA